VKGEFLAIMWLKVMGIVITTLSLALVLIFAEPQRLAYLSWILFKHQDSIKTAAILGIFIGTFFLFYTSSKLPGRLLKLKLFKGPMKMHSDVISQTLQTWFDQQKRLDLSLIKITILADNRIALEVKTSNLATALEGFEEIEAKLKLFMEQYLGIHNPVELELFEF
jgi:hypothetical protein